MKCSKCETELEIGQGSFLYNHKWLCPTCACFALTDTINTYRSALREFCQRVERGEIRSVNTYKKFKELLGEPIQ